MKCLYPLPSASLTTSDWTSAALTFRIKPWYRNEEKKVPQKIGMSSLRNGKEEELQDNIITQSLPPSLDGSRLTRLMTNDDDDDDNDTGSCHTLMLMLMMMWCRFGKTDEAIKNLCTILGLMRNQKFIPQAKENSHFFFCAVMRCCFLWCGKPWNGDIKHHRRPASLGIAIMLWKNSFSHSHKTYLTHNEDKCNSS